MRKDELLKDEKKIRTVDDINESIKQGSVTVVTAKEMEEMVRNKGVDEATEEVDVITTETFGALCSSGAFLNFEHL